MIGKVIMRNLQCYCAGGTFISAKRSLHASNSSLIGWNPLRAVILLLLFVAVLASTTVPTFSAPVGGLKLAATPPMGWSAWAHYQCNYTAQTVLANARALARTGLAARGYKMVMTTECWMQKKRDAAGNLQANPRMFPQGTKPVARAIHVLGLEVGIYGDAGYATCTGYAGDGQSKEGGEYHFLRNARLYASWGVDYLKLDGCNVWTWAGQNV